jgi:hypothetical protein
MKLGLSKLDCLYHKDTFDHANIYMQSIAENYFVFDAKKQARVFSPLKHLLTL